MKRRKTIFTTSTHIIFVRCEKISVFRLLAVMLKQRWCQNMSRHFGCACDVRVDVTFLL